MRKGGKERWQQASKKELTTEHLRSSVWKQCLHFPVVNWNKVKPASSKASWLQTEALRVFLSRSETKHRRKENAGMRKVRERSWRGLCAAQCPLYGWAGCPWPPPHLLVKGWVCWRNKDIRETRGSSAVSPGFPAPKPDAYLGNQPQVSPWEVD